VVYIGCTMVGIPQGVPQGGIYRASLFSHSKRHPGGYIPLLATQRGTLVDIHHCSHPKRHPGGYTYCSHPKRHPGGYTQVYTSGGYPRVVIPRFIPQVGIPGRLFPVYTLERGIPGWVIPGLYSLVGIPGWVIPVYTLGWVSQGGLFPVCLYPGWVYQGGLLPFVCIPGGEAKRRELTVIPTQGG